MKPGHKYKAATLVLGGAETAVAAMVTLIMAAAVVVTVVSGCSNSSNIGDGNSIGTASTVKPGWANWEATFCVSPIVQPK